MTRKVVRDDQDEKLGRAVPDKMSWDEQSRTRCPGTRWFGAKSPATIRRKYPNAPCCMKAYINHKIHHVFGFADFLFVNKNLYVNLCDKKQIDYVKMKSGLIEQC